VQGPPESTAASDPLGLVRQIDGSGTVLTRLDPMTLRPRGLAVDMGEVHDAWSFSPDGGQVALGTGGQGLGVHVVDVARMRVSRAVRTGIAAEALGWLEPRRLVAALQSGQLVVIDPRSGRVLHRRSIRRAGGTCSQSSSAVTGTGVIVLLRGSRRTTTRLASVDARGRLRAASLGSAALWGCGRAGLAYDPTRERAFVVSRGAQVAEVDLQTMRASYHHIAGAHWRSAHRRGAFWLGDGRLVAFGRDRAGRPVGVSVVDTTTWTSRVLSAAAGEARAIAGTVLAYGGGCGKSSAPDPGLHAYRPDGTEVFHALSGKRIDDVQVAGDRAYAQSDATRRVVNTATGEVTGEFRTSNTYTELIEGPRTRAAGGQPWWWC
jgi:hypothetical protein